MDQLKNSEQMLSFLNDLSKFTQTFSTFTSHKPTAEPNEKPPQQEKPDDKKSPQSPTAGIADEFIQQILENYLQKH